MTTPRATSSGWTSGSSWPISSASGTSSPCDGPVRLAAVAPQAGAAAPRLGPGDQHDVGVAVLDVLGRLVHQQLRGVAAVGGARGVPRRGAEPRGDQCTGIAVAPRQDLHDADGVGGAEHRGRRDRLSSAARRSASAIRSSGRARRLAPVDPLVQLAGADRAPACGGSRSPSGDPMSAPSSSHLDRAVKLRATPPASLQSSPSTSCSSAPATSAGRHGRGAPAPSRQGGRQASWWCSRRGSPSTTTPAPRAPSWP